MAGLDLQSYKSNKRNDKKMSIFNIEHLTLKNCAFRRVIRTPGFFQVVLMSLRPGTDIGMEKHDHVDQFIRIEQGNGLAQVGAEVGIVGPGDVLVVKHVTWHNLTSVGSQS